MSYQEFCYDGYDFDHATTTLQLHYSVDSQYHFTESYVFHLANPSQFAQRYQQDPALQYALDKALQYLHIMAGISYYKGFLPQQLRLNTALDAEEAEFFRQFYLYGLGEFAYRNQVNLEELIQFPVTGETVHAKPLKLSPRYLVAIGGGKDSIVSLELLRSVCGDDGLSLCYCSGAEPPAVLCNTVQISGLEVLPIQRQVDPLLISMTKDTEHYHLYNGHIPITAINSLVCLINALLNDYDTVVFSNERSANVGNVQHHNLMANHQWSKSWEAEQLMHNLWKHKIASKLNYMSLLRPLSELAITKIFAQVGKAYFHSFASCNRNFKLNDPAHQTFWCGECDKCRFVFLMLAACLGRQAIEIVGHNLLDDVTQLQGYQELLGLSGHKPFECVGEIEEAIAAIGLIVQMGEFQDSQVLTEVLAALTAQGYTTSKLSQLAQQFLTADFSQGYLTRALQNVLQKSL